MNKSSFYSSLFWILYVFLPFNLFAQKKEINISKLGVTGSLYTYNNEYSYSFSPKLQLTQGDVMHSSIGPLFKSDKNYKTTGLDFSIQIHINQCKAGLTPIIDAGFQYFKTKSNSDSIQKNLYLMSGLGFYGDFKYISTSISFGFGINAITSKNDLWFIKISVGCPNLYSYKSLLQTKHKSKRYLRAK